MKKCYRVIIGSKKRVSLAIFDLLKCRRASGPSRLDPAPFKYEKYILLEEKGFFRNILLILRVVGLGKSLQLPFSLTFRLRSVVETRGLVH